MDEAQKRALLDDARKLCATVELILNLEECRQQALTIGARGAAHLRRDLAAMDAVDVAVSLLGKLAGMGAEGPVSWVMVGEPDGIRTVPPNLGPDLLDKLADAVNRLREGRDDVTT